MKIRMLHLAALTGMLVPASLASASTMHYSNTQYVSAESSPFTAQRDDGNHTYWLEDFEDGLLNSLGLSADVGEVKSPGEFTDSVDRDGSGNVDGLGLDGYSYKYKGEESTTIVFSFDDNALGQLPTYAGLVWTDGASDAMVTFEAFDAGGNSLGTLNAMLGDETKRGTTEEDRFFGISDASGIAAIAIHSTFGVIEVDHIQYGFASAVMPVPPAAIMGLAGLAGVAAWRRRRK